MSRFADVVVTDGIPAMPFSWERNLRMMRLMQPRGDRFWSGTVAAGRAGSVTPERARQIATLMRQRHERMVRLGSPLTWAAWVSLPADEAWAAWVQRSSRLAFIKSQKI